MREATNAPAVGLCWRRGTAGAGVVALLGELHEGDVLDSGGAGGGVLEEVEGVACGGGDGGWDRGGFLRGAQHEGKGGGFFDGQSDGRRWHG